MKIKLILILLIFLNNFSFAQTKSEKRFERDLKKISKLHSGYRTVFNCNDDGGQTVFHIHLHLIGGRSLNWPPG